MPWRMVEFTCSRISVVFASPLSSRNFLIFCLSLVVLILPTGPAWLRFETNAHRMAGGNITVLYDFSLNCYN